MRKTRIRSILALFIILAILAAAAAGCSSKGIPEGTDAYSGGIDANGLWDGVTALDHVELADYNGLVIPVDTHTIGADAIQSQVDAVLAEYATTEEITDRSVADGDTVNIDYVGSIDGVEFDGGSTGGQGTDVTLGVTVYIDDFLEQLIGHDPGESFDIEVTFPDDYGNEELNGKDAVFAITINHISETIIPEPTDAFVADTLSDVFGWTTVVEMNDSIEEDLRQTAIAEYIQTHLLEQATVASIPDELIEYQEQALILYYVEYASYYDMELEEFLESYMDVSGTEELLSQNTEQNAETAAFFLVIQAIAEDAGISVSDDDVSVYFLDLFEAEDITEYVNQYGMPYLKMLVLHQTVLDYLIDNAVLE